jgi:exo-beta-1,3-glucanase (GH17 family)
MQAKTYLFFLSILILFLTGCREVSREQYNRAAAEILGDPEYLAISYGGFREKSRDTVPEVDQLAEDMRILSAMGIRLIRTYNTQQFPHASRVLEAIHQIKEKDPAFEMYVMLGAWIDCRNAWTDTPDHTGEDEENNRAEIEAAVRLAQKYPDIVRIIAVGNEAMVHWAASYFVEPEVILKWVNYLQGLKQSGDLREELWITSSDNFASWGGGDSSYYKPALNELIRAVDYISLHTYPFHDTHYNPAFWLDREEPDGPGDRERIDAAVSRALEYAQMQYNKVVAYVENQGVSKPVHIGETGWASVSDGYYGPDGSRAADEYKQGKYYELIRDWTNRDSISCFYFEAFDEQWKDALNPMGSENHFGLIRIDGEVKYALWDLVDKGVFEGLTRDGMSLRKTFGGDEEKLMEEVLPPPYIREESTN